MSDRSEKQLYFLQDVLPLWCSNMYHSSGARSVYPAELLLSVCDSALPSARYITNGTAAETLTCYEVFLNVTRRSLSNRNPPSAMRAPVDFRLRRRKHHQHDHQPPRIALAEVGVGEGGLPDGARQFSNFVKVQKDWAALGASIKGKGADVTAEEWKNVALFLRKVYQLGGDLEYLAGTFPPDKKKTALALVKGIQVCCCDEVKVGRV